jgi:hypothetical protein
MVAMEAALASIESLDEGGHFKYTNVAKIYNMDRSTLSQRHRKVQAPKAEQAINQQLLSPHQEEELVQYIIRLTERGLSPTREMTTNFARKVEKRRWERGGWTDLWPGTRTNLLPDGALGWTATGMRLIQNISIASTLIYLSGKSVNTQSSQSIPTTWMKRGS